MYEYRERERERNPQATDNKLNIFLLSTQPIGFVVCHATL